MKCGLRATCYVARNCRGSVLQTSRRWCGLLRLSLVGKAAKDMCRQLFRALAGSFQDCGAFLVPTQWTWTRRRLRVVQGSHRPSLCPPLAKTWKTGPAEHAAIAGKEAMGSTLFVRC